MRSSYANAAALAALAALLVMPPRSVTAQEITNSDVYVTATELADEVELIREAMGRPFDDSPRLPVSGVGLFELYLQAETLLVKSNRLAHELAGVELVFPPPLPAGDIVAADILALVEAALADVRRVRAELGVTEEVVREERGTPIAATGVFSIVLDTNRQLNLLLDDSIGSADVHGRLVLATTLAAGILRRTGAAAPSVALAHEPRLPGDVFRVLLDCIGLVTDAGRAAGVDMLTLSARRNVPITVTPGHVYDVAQFLVADLTLLARRLEADAVEVDLGPFPRHVFPSHNYALAEHIQRQLEAIGPAL